MTTKDLLFNMNYGNMIDLLNGIFVEAYGDEGDIETHEWVEYLVKLASMPNYKTEHKITISENSGKSGTFSASIYTHEIRKSLDNIPTKMAVNMQIELDKGMESSPTNEEILACILFEMTFSGLKIIE